MIAHDPETEATFIHKLLRKLRSKLNVLDPSDLILDCGTAVISKLPTDPAAITALAYQKLHVFPFSAVPDCWRRAYEEGCVWSVVRVLESVLPRGDGDGNAESRAEQQMLMAEDDWWIGEVVRLCDQALIMTGAPGRKDVVHWVLRELEVMADEIAGVVTASDCPVDDDYELQSDRPRKRMKLSLPPPKQDATAQNSTNPSIYSTPPSPGNSQAQPPKPPVQSIHGSASMSKAPPLAFLKTSRPITQITHSLTRLPAPSLETFHAHLHNSRAPVILQDSITHWPALERWKQPDYWMRRTLGGSRLVPVETGRSYVDSGWGQKIIKFGDFMREYLLDETGGVPGIEVEGSETEDWDERGGGIDTEGEDCRTSEDATEPHQPGRAGSQTPTHSRSRGEQIGYLAQHDLLAQIPALRNDIAIPDYCYVVPPRDNPPIPPHADGVNPGDANHSADSDDMPDTPDPDPLLNIWLGPASTISPCHTDPHYNILAQVFGRKYVRLYPPEEETEHGRMYPMSNAVPRPDQASKEASPSTELDSAAPLTKPADVGDAGGENDSAIDMSNTSRVDVSAYLNYESPAVQARHARRREAQQKSFPSFETARYVEGVLGPGECLYIPKGWWHYVMSLEASCSVSFWWD